MTWDGMRLRQFRTKVQNFFPSRQVAEQLAPPQPGYDYLLQEFGDGPGVFGLKSALSQLWRGGAYEDYADPRTRLAALLGFCVFAGDLRLSGANAHRHGEGAVMFLRRKPANYDRRLTFKTIANDSFTYIPEDELGTLTAQMSIRIGRNKVELWRCMTKPDGVFAPPDQEGSWTELVAEETACARTPSRASGSKADPKT